MVKNVNPFKRGMDFDRRPLTDIMDEPQEQSKPEPQEQGDKPARPDGQPAAVDVQRQVEAMSQAKSRPAEETEPDETDDMRAEPARQEMHRIGSDVTAENWRAWKMASITTGFGQKQLLNMAFEYAFTTMTPEFLALADKYRKLPKYATKQEREE